MLTLYKPRPEELDFRARLLADEATMAYNRAWGGTIAFPPERRADWAARWLNAPEMERFSAICAMRRPAGMSARPPITAMQSAAFISAT